MSALPTTPGSIVTFDLPPDSDGTVYRAVASLIPGHIDEEGIAHGAVWAAADLEDAEDAGCVFSKAHILAANPAVEVRTRRAVRNGESVLGDDTLPGTVIQVREHGVWMTYTYAPCFTYGGELCDLFWTNSDGGFWRRTEDDPQRVLYVPE